MIYIWKYFLFHSIFFAEKIKRLEQEMESSSRGIRGKDGSYDGGIYLD